MIPERRQRIEALFEAALSRSPAERPGWLEKICGSDRDLLRAVRRLLEAHERAGGILDLPASVVGAALEEAERARWAVPEHVGPYRLVREIGRGGMGRVYLAQRDDGQYRQRVAVKLIPPGLDTGDLVRRFLAERQILASLHHPHIARLLHGGVTDDGRPYLVMEYVEGEPIDRYCDRRRLPIEERLRLVCTVCRAVQHAHRALVIHRDLKPANILVSAEGEIKLLDFGTAKLLDGPPGPQAAVTRTGPGPMTPEYASPEQVRGGPVTTATDVYGLGMVLFQLLCGRHPYPPLEGCTAAAAERIICEAEPPRPSTVVARGGSVQLARARGTRPERLRRRLRGDLDRIVLTALRKEPERRYASAERLAEDIEAHLCGRPIRARSDSPFYRAGKFLRRHRWGVATAAGFLILVAGYALTVTLKQRQVRLALERAQREAEKAEQVTTFLMRLFESPDPHRAGNDAITARGLLERGVARAEQLHRQPGAQAQLLDALGRTYHHLGQYDRAQPLLERALAIRRREFGARHPSVAQSEYHLGLLAHSRGHYDSATARFRHALELQRRLLDPEHPHVARTLDGLAAVLQERGAYAPAERLAREALGLRRRLLGAEHPEVAESLHRLADILRRQGRYDAAEPLYRDALAMRRRLFGEQHPAVATTLRDLAYALQLRGELHAAEPLYRDALAKQRRLFGHEHPSVASTISNLGLLRFQQGDLAEAERLYREALQMRRRVLGDQHPDVALSMGLLAALLRRKGELQAAEALYRASLQRGRRLLGTQHPDLAHSMNGLALVLRDRGEYDSADSLYREVLAMRRSLLGAEHPAVAMTLNDRAVLMMRRGDSARAESLLLRALAMRRQLLGEHHPHVTQSLEHLVALYQGWGRREELAAYRALLHGR